MKPEERGREVNLHLILDFELENRKPFWFFLGRPFIFPFWLFFLFSVSWYLGKGFLFLLFMIFKFSEPED